MGKAVELLSAAAVGSHAARALAGQHDTHECRGELRRFPLSRNEALVGRWPDGANPSTAEGVTANRGYILDCQVLFKARATMVCM